MIFLRTLINSFKDMFIRLGIQFSQANYLYSHLLNVPTHPDLAILSDTELTHEISQVIEFATLDRNGKNTAEVRAQF